MMTKNEQLNMEIESLKRDTDKQLRQQELERQRLVEMKHRLDIMDPQDEALTGIPIVPEQPHPFSIEAITLEQKAYMRFKEEQAEAGVKREEIKGQMKEAQDWMRVFQKCLVERGEAKWYKDDGITWIDEGWWKVMPWGPNEMCWNAAAANWSLYDFNNMMNEVRWGK